MSGGIEKTEVVTSVPLEAKRGEGVRHDEEEDG